MGAQARKRKNVNNFCVVVVNTIIDTNNDLWVPRGGKKTQCKDREG